MRDIDLRRYEHLKADRELINQAVAYLRGHARQDHVAACCIDPRSRSGSSILNELSRQLAIRMRSRVVRGMGMRCQSSAGSS